MNDGFYVPARHDGMATFSGPDGYTLLIRNHELRWDTPGRLGPFGQGNELLGRLDPGAVYDIGESGRA